MAEASYGKLRRKLRLWRACKTWFRATLAEAGTKQYICHVQICIGFGEGSIQEPIDHLSNETTSSTTVVPSSGAAWICSLAPIISARSCIRANPKWP